MCYCLFLFFQAEDGIRDLVRSRGLGDVYKRQVPARIILLLTRYLSSNIFNFQNRLLLIPKPYLISIYYLQQTCLLYTSDAADERSSVDLGGRRIIKKKNKKQNTQKHNTIIYTK